MMARVFAQCPEGKGCQEEGCIISTSNGVWYSDVNGGNVDVVCVAEILHVFRFFGPRSLYVDN